MKNITALGIVLSQLSHCRRIGTSVAVGATFLAALFVSTVNAEEWVSGIPWPKVKVVEPGTAGGPPSDAIVLFDGHDLSQWEGGDQWKIKDGYAISAARSINTKRGFGDCQLHIEWASPEKVEGTGQGRGNSGVFLMNIYEVQVLDSHNNETYADGQAAAIYKQHPPLANVCRKPGEWQTYDILFEAPRVRQTRQAASPGLYHRHSKRRCGAESLSNSRRNGLGLPAEVYGPCVEIADRLAISRQSCPIPQYLGS